MQIGMVGLGRMGGSMAARLLRGGHEVVAYALDEKDVAAAVARGATGAGSLQELTALIAAPRVIWVMVPAGDATERTIAELRDLLDAGDTIIDGGNSRYTDSLARAAALSERGISFADVGTSGGIWGLQEGYCLMVGTDERTFETLSPIFETLAPPGGSANVGPVGAGHFTKMVHNGIEYGIMQAYAEGFELLDSTELDVDVADIAELWRHGSVIRSWLLDLAAEALRDDPGLESLTGRVEDSGEGRWMIEAAIERGIPTPALTAALFARFESRREGAFSSRLLSALRREFGGHGEKSAGP